MPTKQTLLSAAVLTALVCLPTTGWAQAVGAEDPNDLSTTHSVLQKTGLGTLAVSGALGAVLMMNKPTLFGDGRCAGGDPLFGEFGCSGLSLVHFGFAASTLVLFVSSEIIAEKMPANPYELDTTRGDAMRALRYVNIGLFAVQPVIGLFAAHPGLLGIPEEARPYFSRVLRTVHFGVGLGVATTYTVNAALQW